MGAESAFVFGGVLGIAGLTALVRIFTRRVTPDWMRAILSVGIAYLIAGFISGFGFGEGGFGNRIETMLSGLGFEKYWLPALIVLGVWLFVLALRPNDAGRAN